MNTTLLAQRKHETLIPESGFSGQRGKGEEKTTQRANEMHYRYVLTSANIIFGESLPGKRKNTPHCFDAAEWKTSGEEPSEKPPEVNK